MTKTDGPVKIQNFHAQIALWRRQANSIPGLPGGKSVWLPLTLELVKQIGDEAISDLESTPQIPAEIFEVEPASGGVVTKTTPTSWRGYYLFLRGVGLVENSAHGFILTSAGRKLQSDPTPMRMAKILADRIRLFAETLAMMDTDALTVEEAHDQVKTKYRPSWKGVGNTRSRMDWQEKLGLIMPIGSRRWKISQMGRDLLADRVLVSPQAFKENVETDVEIAAAPSKIATLLEELNDSVRDHLDRNTYNIWVPSPPSNPNKVENLRTIINAAMMNIERSELFSFISDKFDLKRSSVESMLPFMRASGLLVEVGRGVYEATSVAKEWIESGDDINFVRILHLHMRYVGEMIHFAETDVTRSEIYAQGKLYGLNVDKCRWIASFLMNTGLVEEPRYGSLRATPLGVELVRELPLAEVPSIENDEVKEFVKNEQSAPIPAEPSLQANIIKLAKEPNATGAKSGLAFEYLVRDSFRIMGFDARVISGSGDTDVLVQWQEDDGVRKAAVVEVKARSSGHVSHNDVSDVALETHKRRNNAEYVAVVGPGFSGDTIRNMAEQRGWSLIEAERLGSLVESVRSLGLRPCEAALLFKPIKGLSELDDLIAERSRELDVVSFIFTKIGEEMEDDGEAISARDISRDGRKTELAPSVAEVMAGMDLVSRLPFHALKQVEGSEKPEYTTYVLGDVGSSVKRLRALADAMERKSLE